MSFHRFVVIVEVTVAAPGASNEPGTPADQELTDSVTKSLRQAAVGKVKGKRQGKDYTVQKVEKA